MAKTAMRISDYVNPRRPLLAWQMTVRGVVTARPYPTTLRIETSPGGQSVDLFMPHADQALMNTLDQTCHGDMVVALVELQPASGWADFRTLRVLELDIDFAFLSADPTGFGPAPWRSDDGISQQGPNTGEQDNGQTQADAAQDVSTAAEAAQG